MIHSFTSCGLRATADDQTQLLEPFVRTSTCGKKRDGKVRLRLFVVVDVIHSDWCSRIYSKDKTEVKLLKKANLFRIIVHI